MAHPLGGGRPLADIDGEDESETLFKKPQLPSRAAFRAGSGAPTAREAAKSSSANGTASAAPAAESSSASSSTSSRKQPRKQARPQPRSSTIGGGSRSKSSSSNAAVSSRNLFNTKRREVSFSRKRVSASAEPPSVGTSTSGTSQSQLAPEESKRIIGRKRKSISPRKRAAPEASQGIDDSQSATGNARSQVLVMRPPSPTKASQQQPRKVAPLPSFSFAELGAAFRPGAAAPIGLPSAFSQSQPPARVASTGITPEDVLLMASEDDVTMGGGDGDADDHEMDGDTGGEVFERVTLKKKNSFVFSF